MAARRRWRRSRRFRLRSGQRRLHRLQPLADHLAPLAGVAHLGGERLQGGRIDLLEIVERPDQLGRRRRPWWAAMASTRSSAPSMPIWAAMARRSWRDRLRSSRQARVTTRIRARGDGLRGAGRQLRGRGSEVGDRSHSGRRQDLGAGGRGGGSTTTVDDCLTTAPGSLEMSCRKLFRLTPASCSMIGESWESTCTTSWLSLAAPVPFAGRCRC